MVSTTYSANPLHSPFTFARATRPHPEHIERNEDYITIDRSHGLAVICDGVGSSSGADQAARLAARTVKTSWQRLLAQAAARQETFAPSELVSAARQLLDEANQAVLAHGKLLSQDTTLAGMASAFSETTVALTLFYPYHDCYLLTYAHVGDSRVYLLRQNAPLQRLTIDDGYFLWQMSKGELDEQDAARIDQASSVDELSELERAHFARRNGITQSLGKADILIHVDQVLLCPGDRVLLCTDGIHDNLTDVEISAVLRAGARTTVARKLVREAHVRSQQGPSSHLRAKYDDLSAIVVTSHFHSSNHFA